LGSGSENSKRSVRKIKSDPGRRYRFKSRGDKKEEEQIRVGMEEKGKKTKLVLEYNGELP